MTNTPDDADNEPSRPLNSFIRIRETAKDIMTGTDRAISLGTGAALAISGVVIILAIVFLGASALGGGGGPTDAGNGTPATTTTAPPPSTTPGPTTTTDSPGTTTTPPPTTKTPVRVKAQFEETFRTEIDRQGGIRVIDIVTRNNTVYVTAHGPSQGGKADATMDDFIKAYTATLETDWANENKDWGVDHAVISLYNEGDHHWWTIRIEESWAYRYYTKDVDLQWVTQNVYRTTHNPNETAYLDMKAFRQNISDISGVRNVRSLEQYDSTYFLGIELAETSGDAYNQTIFEISEALWHARANDIPVKLQYVAYAENGTAMVSNRFGSGWSDLWHRDEITEETYRLALVNTEFEATQIPDGIGSMLTRITPFPAKGPGE